jgi:hypothetical protein
MKRAGRLAHVLISFTMFCATTSVAANRGALRVQSPSIVGDTQLPAGEYTVQWEGAGPEVELKIKRANRVTVTVPGKVIPLDQPFRENEPVFNTDGDGRQRLVEIRFPGRRFFLEIEAQSASTTSPQPPLLSPECESGLPW